MKTIKTAEAEGPVLDWLVLMCEGCTTLGEPEGVSLAFEFAVMHPDDPGLRYSTNWSQGGPIIEREKIATVPAYDGWTAVLDLDEGDCMTQTNCGPTPLIAAMRCYVASTLGETAEVPEELV